MMTTMTAPSRKLNTRCNQCKTRQPRHLDDDDESVQGPESLPKLVIPWIFMAVVSIVATIILSYRDQYSSNKHEVLFQVDEMTTVESRSSNSNYDYSQKWELDELLSSSEHYYPPTFDDNDLDNQGNHHGSIISSSSGNGIYQRWLQLSPNSVVSSSVTQHHHATSSHKHVYEDEHPPLFPLSTSDRLGFFLAILGLMIAAGGGIGGGGLLVPIYILVMGFSPKHAIPLSNITVLGGAVANMVLNSKKRHPLADRPLIDWDLILVMEPLTIAGALIGAFLNKVLPEIFLTIMLVVLLAFTAYTTLKKAFKMYKAETRKLREQGLKPDGTKESELTHIAQSEEIEDQNKAGDDLLDDMDLQDGESPGTGEMEDARSRSEASQTQLQTILDEERTTPMFNVNVLFCMFIVVLMINLLKGGGAFPSPIGIKCGSGAFWLANGFMLGWIILISLYVRSYLIKRFDIKASCGYQYQEGDIKWDGRATIVYPVICALAGFFAGMFGVGGGIVKGPLMLAMGVHPAVASASSACMILFTSFTASTSFFVFGLLDEQYAPVCFTIGFIATYFGQIGLSLLMKRAQRNSYIAFSIGGVVFLSAILMTIQSLLSMAEGEHHSSGGICGKDS